MYLGREELVVKFVSIFIIENMGTCTCRFYICTLHTHVFHTIYSVNLCLYMYKGEGMTGLQLLDSLGENP